MMARFLHFYPGYTAEQALAMPWRRFVALVRVVDVVRAEESLLRLEVAATAAHPGEKGEGYRALVKRLQHVMGLSSKRQEKSTLAPGLMPLARVEAVPGSIAAERARQKAAWEELVRQKTEDRSQWPVNSGQ